MTLGDPTIFKALTAVAKDLLANRLPADVILAELQRHLDAIDDKQEAPANSPEDRELRLKCLGLASGDPHQAVSLARDFYAFVIGEGDLSPRTAFTIDETVKFDLAQIEAIKAHFNRLLDQVVAASSSTAGGRGTDGGVND